MGGFRMWWRPHRNTIYGKIGAAFGEEIYFSGLYKKGGVY